MAKITKYAVCNDPDEWGDAPLLGNIHSAREMAEKQGHCVVELTYEYSDARPVEGCDFRTHLRASNSLACGAVDDARAVDVENVHLVTCGACLASMEQPE